MDNVTPAKRRVGDGTPGPGRPKGSVNRTTAQLKDAILIAAEQAHPEGLVGYLRVQAIENAPHFMTLLGRVLPYQMTGEGDGPLKIVISKADADL